MTNEQKANIVRLRYSGWGYRKISIALDIPRDPIRTYCKSMGVDGYAKDLVREKEAIQMEEICGDSFCRQCSKPVLQNKTGRKKKYCSDICKKQWEKKHPKLYQHECRFCGKIFESSSSQQRFCNKDCYIRNRFWRKEDTEEIVKLLLEGKRIPNAPKWLKDLILDS